MMTNEIYRLVLDKNYGKDLVEINFEFKIDYLSDTLEEDPSFIFENELITGI